VSAGAPVVVPVNLGCCASLPRCLLCPPAPVEPGPDLVDALVGHYRTERTEPGRDLRVGFFGGAPPSDALLDAIAGVPFTVRVRPDLLTRAALERLVTRGVSAVELDALTLDDAVLQGTGRAYRGRWVLAQIDAIRAAGVRVGAVLSPGLPGSSHADAVHDSEVLAPLIDFARLHPVLVLQRAGLRAAHMDGRYTPLTLGQAVTTCRAMLERLEADGVEVVRVGQNPGPDGLGRAVAGPMHPSLRQLVQARQVIADLHALMPALDADRVQIRCNPADETHTRGPRNQHLRDLRAAHGLREVRVVPDPTLARGALRLEPLEGA